MKAKRYLIYWHKCANSGLWGYEDLVLADSIAKDFKEQKQMYEVHLVDTKLGTIKTYKGKCKPAIQER